MTDPLTQSLETFLDDLLAEKGFTTPTPTFLNEVKTELRPLLIKSINTDLFLSLSQADQQALTQLLESDSSPEDIRAFISTHAKDQEYTIAQSLLNFRNSYLGL